jgi:membrane protease YdiL (CAAX protease family)|tara:strand:+ start:875 stop:1774 length:900 start_codon:yes stop_codon:yes gene_type:complete
LNLKGSFSNTHLFSKISLLFGLIVSSVILHSLLALLIVYFSVEDGFSMFFSYDLSSKLSVNIMKLVQFFSAIGTFVTPILIYGYLVSFDFHLKKSFNRQSVLVVLAIMILITPLVSFLLEWNMTINFPDWILKYDMNSEAIVLAFLNMNNYWDLLFNIIIMAIIPAIGEELLFRGLLQQSLIKQIGNIHVSIFITAFLFSAIHLHFNGLVPRIFLGIVLGYLFYWSKSLWIPIIAHFINNAMAIILSYPFFKSFNLIQNYNYSESLSASQTSIYYAFFSLCSVILLMFLFYKNSRIKKD